MEGVHGVDVSWLHHANNKDSSQRRTPTNGTARPKGNPSTPDTPTIRSVPSDTPKLPTQPHVTPPSLSAAKQDETPAVSSMSSPVPSPIANGHTRTQSSSRRPQMGSRTNSEKSVDDGTKSSSRPRWINNLSSKFSSQSTPTRTTQTGNLPLKSPPISGPTTALSPAGGEAQEAAEPYIPQKPRESGSFFSSLSRRLSAGSQTSNTARVSTSGAICPRKVLNVDPNRERCLVPELDSNKLRKVSFCVDVEIAGGPKYKDEPDNDVERQRKKKEVKLRERAEGEALKNPEAQKDEETEANRSRSTSLSAPKPNTQPAELQNDEDNQEGLPRDSMDENSVNRKKEKKKRSEAERKERKEQRLRRAQESGQIPVEIGGDDEDEAPSDVNTPVANTPVTPVSAKPPTNGRPTTDPARIYRRCCSLRETPILKRITEQLMSPKSMLPNEPGVVSCLDLTGSRMQLPDVITLGDWLAVVPVKRLLLEDADLNDEGVRCVLAGLLAAKRPEPTKRKFVVPRHREGLGPPAQYQERSGIVEKITFKNNPRISRVGWKHISLFIYMCRSIKAIDLSMNKFPDAVPSSTASPQPTKPSVDSTSISKDVDAAEILFKCLSERLGGNRLEELSVSECGLKAGHIRKIVDGAIMCGISRLGLAGNNLNDAGLDHVMHYLKSGLCHGIDLGGNNLKGKLDRIADSLVAKPNNPCWGLSLADCELDAESVKPLFSAVIQLPNFRFIDLSHNRKLCRTKDSRYNIITLLRRYIPQMKELKRIHLNNVGMTTKQAIALAEVLPEGPRLAHVSVLENPQLSALANNTDEASQEEACALYASFMMAVRCSHTLICIDLDVPSPETGEVVKALAKQVVAYSLRNMEEFAIAEATGDATADAAARLSAPHGGEKDVKKMSYPDVLMHLVGHVDGIPENHDNDDPAPDDDYIVGGTGVVKALQYVLGEKANDLRRTSMPGSPASGPIRSRPGSSAGLDQMGKVKAKQMSRSLLDTARKIRQRLHPAIVKEATAGDEMAYRRLQFLDHTLQSMIDRFEEEYPETRVQEGVSQQASAFLDLSKPGREISSTEDEMPPELDLAADDDEDESDLHPGFVRRNSDASLASRTMTLEEGRLHRHGQRLRRDVINSSSPNNGPIEDAGNASEKLQLEKDRIRTLAEKLESVPGEVLVPMVDKHGWAAVLQQWGANYEDLRAMQEQDPEGWEQFTDAQMKAKMNLDHSRSGNLTKPGPNMF
ncbi:hypothetical protein AMS68_001821 [Peltaster fructicola]|uniref:Uncharacterized protein n=1 Tax=Peltaster fructicola TaxID=286661 RepID=A0A6H0XNK8_9PEZI|nr:hypothetical protein AMS68_001821 [Peltaster fructicola]